MHPSAAFGLCVRVATAVIGACAAAAVMVASPGAATPPTSRACPSAAVVNAALGQHGGAPVATKTQYSKTCTYPGKSKVFSTKITFQVDTASQFAVDEKAAGKFGAKIVKVHGLGQAAWTTNGGDLYIFDGHEQIKILALLTPTARLEVLARKLL